MAKISCKYLQDLGYSQEELKKLSWIYKKINSDNELYLLTKLKLKEIKGSKGVCYDRSNYSFYAKTTELFTQLVDLKMLEIVAESIQKELSEVKELIGYLKDSNKTEIDPIKFYIKKAINNTNKAKGKTIDDKIELLEKALATMSNDF